MRALGGGVLVLKWARKGRKDGPEVDGTKGWKGKGKGSTTSLKKWRVLMYMGKYIRHCDWLKRILQT